MPSISGVSIRELRQIHDERGYLMEVLRNDDPEYNDNFGQVYISAVYGGVIKAWHLHTLQTDRVCCVSGRIRLGLIDARDFSESKGCFLNLVIGEGCPRIVTIPNGVLHGWKGLTDTALVMNIPDRPYVRSNPDEIRIQPHVTCYKGIDIDFDWSLKHG